MKYPLLFGYRDVILGNGFVAGVACDGRALLVQEGEGEFWMYGVNPGALAAPGCDHGDATKAFRQAYKAVLIDAAAEVATFDDFQAELERFFAETSPSMQMEWEEAVQAVRAGDVTANWLAKRPAGTPCGITVELISRVQPDRNELDLEEALADVA